MAVVVMTFRDSPHGTIEIGGEVDPPIVDGEERTPAQELGFRILQELYAIQEAGKLQRATMEHIAKGTGNGPNRN